MAGTTTNRGYPYPEGSDGPAGMSQIELLAEAVDNDVTKLPQGYIADVIGTENGATKLATQNQWYWPPNTFYVLTLATRRRIRFDAHANVGTATAAAGLFSVGFGYNTGSNPPTNAAGITVFGNYMNVNAPGAGYVGGWQHGVVTLDPGTYRLYPIVQRAGAGSNTDSIVGTCQISVYDEGAG